MEINTFRRAFIVGRLLNQGDERVICQEIEWFAMGNDNKTTISFWHQTKHITEGVMFSPKQYTMSLVVRKPVFGVSDQVRHKPGCTAAEDG